VHTIPRLASATVHPIPRLLAATPADALLRHDIYSLTTPLPSYYSGRVVLRGDAAQRSRRIWGRAPAWRWRTAPRWVRARPGLIVSVHKRLRRQVRSGQPAQRLVRVSALSGRAGQWRNPVAAAVRDGPGLAHPPSV
jgi:hypothetical protein